MWIKSIYNNGFIESGKLYEIVDIHYFYGNESYIKTECVDITEKTFRPKFAEKSHINIRNDNGNIIPQLLKHFDYTEIRRNLIIDELFK